jgi:hypothetical protein
VTVTWPTPSIRARLLLGTAGLLAAASLAPILVLPDRREAHGPQELERRALDVARAFGAASEVALDFGDGRRAVEVLRRLAWAGGATHGRLLQADGVPLASWGRVPRQAWPARTSRREGANGSSARPWIWTS